MADAEGTHSLQFSLQRSRDVAAAETATTTKPPRLTYGFNGAATLPPRKLRRRLELVLEVLLLQRSRDVAAAETVPSDGSA